MPIYISRDGEQNGPYSIEDINAYLDSGALLPTDLACMNGWRDWESIFNLPGVIIPWRHTPEPDPSAYWCPICKSHTEYKLSEFLGPTYSSYTKGETSSTHYYISGSAIFTMPICQKCNTTPPLMKGSELYDVGKYSKNWGSMFIPDKTKPIDKPLKLALFVFGLTAIGYMVWRSVSNSDPTVPPPNISNISLLYIASYVFCAGMWFLCTLRNRKRYWAWSKWAKQQNSKSSSM